MTKFPKNLFAIRVDKHGELVNRDFSEPVGRDSLVTVERQVEAIPLPRRCASAASGSCPSGVATGSYKDRISRSCPGRAGPDIPRQPERVSPSSSPPHRCTTTRMTASRRSPLARARQEASCRPTPADPFSPVIQATGEVLREVVTDDHPGEGPPMGVGPERKITSHSIIDSTYEKPVALPAIDETEFRANSRKLGRASGSLCGSRRTRGTHSGGSRHQSKPAIGESGLLSPGVPRLRGRLPARPPPSRGRRMACRGRRTAERGRVCLPAPSF